MNRDRSLSPSEKGMRTTISYDVKVNEAITTSVFPSCCDKITSMLTGTPDTRISTVELPRCHHSCSYSSPRRTLLAACRKYFGTTRLNLRHNYIYRSDLSNRHLFHHVNSRHETHRPYRTIIIASAFNLKTIEVSVSVLIVCKTGDANSYSVVFIPFCRFIISSNG